MQLFGAILLMVSAIFFGISKSCERERTVKNTRDVCAILHKMGLAIGKHEIGLFDFFRTMGYHPNGELAGVFEALSHLSAEIQDKPFQELWNDVWSTSHVLPREGTEVILQLGPFLGQFCAEEQKDVIENCEEDMRKVLERIEEETRKRIPCIIALSAAVGFVTILMIW